MADAAATLCIGLMSGTSLDGVDAALVDFSGPPRLLAHAHHAFGGELRDAMAALNSPGWDDLHRAAVAAQHLVRAYAAAVQDVLLDSGVEPAAVAAIGAHGQTVRHRPEAGYTLQLNAPATLAELTGIDVVADFRSRDVAAGGQGAPLVPAFHAAVFTTDRPRAVVNVGGMANLTRLPAAAGAGEAEAPVTGFDTGPGNVLMDLWIARQEGRPFDRDGAWAASGEPDPALLASLLEEPFFDQPPPRSTGRERFNAGWLAARLGGNGRLSPADVQATLTQLSAVSIARAIEAHAHDVADVVICGGGARNATLMRMLQATLPQRPVRISDELGFAAEHVEAMAFAWLARACVQRQPGNVPAVTGAKGPRVLGAIYPAA